MQARPVHPLRVAPAAASTVEVQSAGCEGIVSKRVGSLYHSGRSKHWIKVKNPAAPAVKRESEEDWSRQRLAVAVPIMIPRVPRYSQIPH
jgi:hypothetical protein